jgi:hypothetical protein
VECLVPPIPIILRPGEAIVELHSSRQQVKSHLGRGKEADTTRTRTEKIRPRRNRLAMETDIKRK